MTTSRRRATPKQPKVERETKAERERRLLEGSFTWTKRSALFTAIFGALAAVLSIAVAVATNATSTACRR